LKRQEKDNYLQLLHQETDEENNRLLQAKNENRLISMELDSLANKKKILEKDLEHLQEKILNEQHSYQKDSYEMKKTHEILDKTLSEGERKISELKEKIHNFENEKVILKESIGLLKQQSVDMEKSLEEKKILLKNEVNHFQNQIYSLQKSLKSLTSSYEQKQSSYHTLLSEIRIQERKNDENKRVLIEEEMRYENNSELNKSLLLEKDKLTSELSLLKENYSEMKKESFQLKQLIEINSKQLNEIEKNKNLLLNNEKSIKDSENSLKSSIHLLTLQKNELNNEIVSLKQIMENDKNHIHEFKTTIANYEHTIHILKDEINSLKLYKNNYELQQQENMKSKSTIQQDVTSLQKEKNLLEFSIQEYKEKLKDYNNQENLLKENISSYKTDVGHLLKEKEKEKSSLLNVSFEMNEMNIKHANLVQEIANIEAVYLEKKTAYQSLQLNFLNLEKEKNFYENLIYNLQENQSLERKNYENLEKTSTELKTQITQLRTDLKLFEENYEKTRNLTQEEKKKYEVQKNLLSKSLVELNELENSIKTMGLFYDEQKQKNLKEISLLQNMKQNTQSEFLLLSQAKDKIQAIAPSSSSSSSPPPPIVHRPTHLSAAASSSSVGRFPSSSSYQTTTLAAPTRNLSDLNNNRPAYALARNMLPNKTWVSQQPSHPHHHQQQQQQQHSLHTQDINDNDSQASSENNPNNEVIELSSLQKAVENLKNRSLNATKSVHQI
jgi:hypothetical protein